MNVKSRWIQFSKSNSDFGFSGSLISVALTLVVLVEQGAIIAEDRCTDGERVSSNSSWYTVLHSRSCRPNESDSFYLPRSGRGSDKSVSVIVVPG